MKDLLILVVALLAMAVLMRLDFVYYVIYVLAGIWLLARWATPRSLRQMRVTRHFVDHAFLGETIPVSLELHNTTRLPVPWLRVNEGLPLELATTGHLRRACSLKPRERLVITYQLQCRRRGYYMVGPMQLASGDLFGFADVQGRDVGQQYLTVYPRIIPLVGLGLPSRLPFGTLASTQRIFEDPARLRGLRDYQSGDSMRRINWKASAHAETLLVKQFSPAISLESVVFLNLNTGEYDRQQRYGASEWAIVVAASVASYLARERQAVGLATNGVDRLVQDDNALSPADRQAPSPIAARPGRQHLMKLLEVLARIELAERDEPFAVWAQRHAAPLAWGTTVIAVSPNADEAACQGLHTLVRAGLNVVLLAVEPYSRFGVVQERARRLGFSAYLVADEKDLTSLQARSGRPVYRRSAP